MAVMMNEGDLVRFKQDQIQQAEGGETIGIIINVISPDVLPPWIHVMFGNRMRLISARDVDVISETG